jgi:hypothetical protein
VRIPFEPCNGVSSATAFGGIKQILEGEKIQEHRPDVEQTFRQTGGGIPVIYKWYSGHGWGLRRIVDILHQASKRHGTAWNV